MIKKSTKQVERAIDAFREQIGICGYIAVLCHISDVQDVRPDLNDEQAFAVLKQCEAEYNTLIGVDLDLIELHAEKLFPRHPET